MDSRKVDFSVEFTYGYLKRIYKRPSQYKIEWVIAKPSLKGLPFEVRIQINARSFDDRARSICCDRRLSALLCPWPGLATHGIVAAVATSSAQLLENPEGFRYYTQGVIVELNLFGDRQIPCRPCCLPLTHNVGTPGQIFFRGSIAGYTLPSVPFSPPKDATVSRLPQGSDISNRTTRSGRSMHLIVFRKVVLETRPETAAVIMKAFIQAEEIFLHYYDDSNWSRLAWDAIILKMNTGFGRTSLGEWNHTQSEQLERFVGYSHEIGLIDRIPTIDELSAETTRVTQSNIA